MRTPRLRLLSAILAVALFFTLLPVSALAEDSGSTGVSHAASRSLTTDNKDDQGLTYTLNADHTATVANYDNRTPDGVIDIPDTVTKDNIDYTVTAIGNNAFESLNVSSVFIPATVTSIGPFAFRFCKFLATVTFAADSHLKSIGLGAFYGTEHVYPKFKEIKIPDSVETIGNGAFYDCRDLERITLPSALQTLSPVTFYDCTALSEVTFPASLKTIESSAFGGCRNLSEVKLPASLTTIQSSVFHRCSALKTVSYDGSLEQWNHITADNDVLGSSCPSLVTGDYTAQFIPVKDDPFADPPPKTVTITKYTGTESTVILPSTINSWPVTKIGEDALKDHTTITSVTIPASVTEIDKLTAPTVEGYTFDGWYADAAHTTEFDFTQPITGDTTVYAKWTANDYYVSFVTEHGDPPTSQNVKYNGTADDPGKLSAEGYTFIGWYTDDTYSTEFDFTKPIKSNTTVYAKWTANDYYVSFVTEHGDPPTSQNVKYNGTADDPGKLTEEGYTFVGWYTDDTYSTEFDFNQPIKRNTTVYAKWTANDYEVSFVTEHGDPPTSQNVQYNGTADDPGKLTAEGYTFVGWYADAAHTTEFKFSTPITGDTTVYAKWTANDYEVSFITEYGDPPASQNVPYNETATDPGKLSAEGYTFIGWYTDDTYSTEFDFTKPIKSNTTVYAKWTANDYEVSFVTEHGDPPTSQNVQYNGTADDPGTLTAEGYTFDGWYTDDTYSTEFDFSTPITGDTKVYAKWEKNAPNTYALNVSGAFVYVDGVDVTAPAGDTSLQLEKDASVRLVADPDRMPSGMVFDRWTILNGALNADDAEKFETGRTLEEFAFTMPAEPLSIEATPRMQEEEGSDTASVILGVTLGTAATALVAWQAYDLGMSLYQEHWLPADFVMPKTRAELALLLWNTAGRPAPAAQPAFTDITDPDTAQAAQWAAETGLMTPKSADRFKPEKSVTRWKAIRSWKRVTNQNP